MAVKKWTLVDHSQNMRLDSLDLGPADPGGKPPGISAKLQTLRTGLSEGVSVIRLQSGAFALDVLPTRGMGIWKAWHHGEEIGWKSPVRGPVHPQFVPLAEPSGVGWLDGFDELLVRCGLESNGAPEFDGQGTLKYPLHGRIANRPAHFVELTADGDAGEMSLIGEVEETRFHFLKLRLRTTITVKSGVAGFRLRDEVINLSRSPAEAQLLYHANFGRPLLDAGARLVAPVKTVVPRNSRAAEGIDGWHSFSAEEPGFAEQVYFLHLLADPAGATQVLLKNAHSTRGVSLRFNVQQLPCFSLWKNTTALADGYVTGLEPGTNFPNPRSFEGAQGRVVRLAPGAAVAFDFQLDAQGSAADVERVEQAIHALQGGHSPTVHRQTLPGWCAP